MRNKSLLFFGLLTCLLFSIGAFGQKSKLDSLYKVLKTVGEDTNKVNVLFQLTNALITSSNYKEADSLVRIEIQLAQKTNFQRGLADALGNLGAINYYLDDYSEAMNNYLRERKISDSIKYVGGIADSYNGIGEIHEAQGDYQTALDEENSSLELYTKIVDSKGIASAENDIGDVYLDLGNDSLAFSNVLYALNLYEREGDTPLMETPLITLGEISERCGNYSNALSYFTEARKYQEENGDYDGLSTTLKNIASVYMKMKKYNNALSYANKSLDDGYIVHSIDDIAETEKTLGNIYEQMGNPVKAIEYYKDYYRLHDSIYGPNNTKKITNIEKNNEFRILQELEKSKQEKKDAIEKAEETRKNIIIGAACIILLLALVFSFVLFNRFKVTQRQKNIIADKNKEITDSINYAKRIQVAMLPDTFAINNDINENFVLFKPKDIVSGDFYFFAKVNSTLFIAAADCTGHGVPGGFMSMICSEKLHDAIAQSQETSTILQFVNKGIKSALHQSEAESSTHDGMDIALCAIEGKTISYAGANRPLWIIRKNGKEIEEMKATKQAIGGFTPNEHIFESHRINLSPGDTFYIFSDGYADQFGGEKGKKLTTKRFKDKLLSIQEKPMKEQEKELDSFIEGWKSGGEQVDDILVIGVRI